MRCNLSRSRITVIDRYAGRTDTGKVLRSRRRVSWLLRRRIGVLQRMYEYGQGTLLSDGFVLKENVRLEKGSLLDLRRDRPGQRTAPRAVYYRDIFAAGRAFGHIVESGLVEEPLMGRLRSEIEQIFVDLRKNLTGKEVSLPVMDLPRLLQDIPRQLRYIHELKARSRLASCFYWPLDQRVAFLEVTDRTGRYNPGMLFAKIPAVLRHLGRREEKIRQVRPNFRSRLTAVTGKVAEINALNTKLVLLEKPERGVYLKSYSKKALVARTLRLSQDAVNLAIMPFALGMNKIGQMLHDCARRLGRLSDARVKHATLVELFAKAGIIKQANANLLISELAALVWVVAHWESLAYCPAPDELAWLGGELENIRRRVKDLGAERLPEDEIHTLKFGLCVLRGLAKKNLSEGRLDQLAVFQQVLRPIHDGLLALIDLLSIKRQVVYFDRELPLNL